MKGMEGLDSKVNDKWLVSMETDGLTVDQVTADFPFINVTKALEEVKKSDPKNAIIQQCKVPKIAGVVADALLGIHYCTYPHLGNRATIYRSKLVGHKADRRYSLVIRVLM